MLGLAAITLSLGIAYWLIRERDDRVDIASNKHANDVAFFGGLLDVRCGLRAVRSARVFLVCLRPVNLIS